VQIINMDALSIKGEGEHAVFFMIDSPLIVRTRVALKRDGWINGEGLLAKA
jgi:hypothetical protein